LRPKTARSNFFHRLTQSVRDRGIVEHHFWGPPVRSEHLRSAPRYHKTTPEASRLAFAKRLSAPGTALRSSVAKSRSSDCETVFRGALPEPEGQSQGHAETGAR
jgi:hypothetical protein